MAPPAVGLGTLHRLGELPTGGRPVLSLYLSLDAATSSTPAVCESRLEALVAGLVPRAGPHDSERAREMLHTMPALAHGTRSLALFSSDEGLAFASVPLPEPVEAMAVLEAVPWLEPLAGMFTRGDWGVAVLDQRSMRLLRGSPRMLVEFAAVRHELHRRHAPRGLPQLGLRHAMRGPVAEYARHLSGMLMRAHRRRPFKRIVVVAPREMWPLVDGGLHSDLRGRLAGVVALDLHDAPAQEIRSAVAPFLEASPQMNGVGAKFARSGGRIRRAVIARS